jgi:hypothetical protein
MSSTVFQDPNPYPQEAAGYFTIYVPNDGDRCTDVNYVIERLYQSPLTEPVQLHFLYQGISIVGTELMDKIEQYLNESGRPRSTLFINSPNRLEDNILGIVNNYSFPVCDEFLRCEGYWVEDLPKVADNACYFSHMVGRPTTPRIKLFYDIDQNNLNSYFMLSRLADSGIGLWNVKNDHINQLDNWFLTAEEQTKFKYWFNHLCDIQSFDNLEISDQYDLAKGSRKSAVLNSKNWFIDIVFETATQGNVFVPTEKLVRSLISEKPFIVYAAKDYLKNLKLIGFKTFDTVWDEKYDKHCSKTRYDMILSVIKEMCAMTRDDFLNMIQKTKSICEHNKQVLKELNQRYSGNNWLNNIAEADFNIG